MNEAQQRKVFEIALEDYYERLELNHEPDFSCHEIVRGVEIYTDPNIQNMWYGFCAALYWYRVDKEKYDVV